MDEGETKICQNCKREIPADNFTIHTVHCARNIRVCPVCKEPVPQSELEEHHDAMHKLLPCKQCGEKVCGTDLEDHIRDSCANTIKSCRFCELEVPRRELPAHEGYCGVRTEQCAECREWVMIKYRQLHLDSNHGFLRLDDDPQPQPKKELPKATNVLKELKVSNLPSTSTSNGFRPSNGLRNINNESRPGLQMRYRNPEPIPAVTPSGLEMRTRNPEPIPAVASGSGSGNGFGPNDGAWRSNFLVNGVKPPLKRTNDQPQINTNVNAAEKVVKEIASSRGAVKKRPAPPPPADPRRDQLLYSALKRQQKEDHDRKQLNAYNASVGLPPVLNPAQKIDKLRKMDALQNREVDDNNYRERLQGRVWRPVLTDNGHVIGKPDEEIMRRRQEFKNLKPMTPEEFMERFNELQLRKDGEDRARGAGPRGAGARGREGAGGDRFSEIKSSLQELRRGLNEVTAPYNANVALNNIVRPDLRSPDTDSDDEEVRLPCEFCGHAVPARNLVQHQTGCRPDLAQVRARSASPRRNRARAAHARDQPRGHAQGHGRANVSPDEPVIPCEFCAESLPVYLITEHQERCGRDANRLYPD